MEDSLEKSLNELITELSTKQTENTKAIYAKALAQGYYGGISGCSFPDMQRVASAIGPKYIKVFNEHLAELITQGNAVKP